MAENMATNHRFDPEAQYAALGERVEGQGRRLTNLETAVATGFRNVEGSIAGLATEFRNNQRPQWQALSVMLAAAIAIGGLAYWPIREAVNDLRNSQTIIVDRMVTQKELEWRTARSMEDRARTDAAIRDLREGLVPRPELDRVFEGYNQRLADHQRQIDEVKTAQGSVYGQRDALLDLRERLDRLERMRGGSLP